MPLSPASPMFSTEEDSDSASSARQRRWGDWAQASHEDALHRMAQEAQAAPHLPHRAPLPFEFATLPDVAHILITEFLREPEARSMGAASTASWSSLDWSFNTEAYLEHCAQRFQKQRMARHKSYMAKMAFYRRSRKTLRRHLRFTRTEAAIDAMRALEGHHAF